jgi:DNA-binding transcriptional regulator YdaS (Cro superfamily)
MKQSVAGTGKDGCITTQLMVAVADMSDESDIEPAIVDATIRAKEAAGGPTALAAALTESGERISSQGVSKWLRVPAERVLEVERLTGVSRYELRPDVYGPAPSVAAVEQSEAAA